MKREPLLANIRFSKSAKKKIDHMISPLSINMGAYIKKKIKNEMRTASCQYTFFQICPKKFDHMISPLSINMGAYQRNKMKK